MARPRVFVRHWLACMDGEIDGPARAKARYNLSSVGHYLVQPGDVEPPFLIPCVNLYVRFELRDAGSQDFEIRVSWLNPRARLRQAIAVYGPFTMPFGPGRYVKDFTFRLQNIVVPRTGLVSLRIVRLVKGRARVLATDFLQVEKTP